ncbi:MAG: tRNA (adenosine(37)-N6)-threonylcarbamoyltransferase complex dimerization subunit type 1 TsaB [Pseudomonadota bacterium]
MAVLALDTALQRCSAALVVDGEPAAFIVDDMERGHAEHLAPMVARIFEQAGLKPSDVTRVGVVVGPGGFTGVRIALSFARAFGLATGAAVVGVTSLRALAANVSTKDGLVAPVIDARRGQVYAALYDTGEERLAPFVAAPDAAGQLLADAAGGRAVSLVGSGAALLSLAPGRRLTGADPQIDPVILARIAAAVPAPDAPPAPLYLRPPDAKPQRPARPRS